MGRILFVTALLAGICCVLLEAQAPKPLFTAKEAEYGKQLADKSQKVIRPQIKTPGGPAEPFKMIGNLYFVGE